MKIGIIGLGLIGGSIALKLKEVNNKIIIYGFDQNTDSS
jgi:prephenate dehydrogenase